MYSLLLLTIEFLTCVILKTIGIDPISNLLVGVYILAFSITYNIDLLRNEILSKYQQPLIGGYLFRVALLFFDRYGQTIYRLPNSGADSEMFYYNAVSQLAGTMPKNSYGFIALFRFIFSLIGTNRLFAQFIVLLFSIIALCMASMVIDGLHIDDEQKIRAVSVVALLPNFAILSSIFLRESIVTMLIMFSFYFFIQYYHGRSYLNIALCFISIAIAMLFHSGVAGFIIGYAVVLLLNNNRIEGIEYRRYFNIGAAVLFVIVASFLYIQYSNVFFQKFLNIDSLADIANTLDAGGSSYAQYVGDSSSIGNMILYSGPRIIFFLFSPFPWQWRGLPDIIAFAFSGLYYIIVVFSAVRYIFTNEGEERNMVINLLIILACATFVFAWGVSNTGTATRHRDKMVCVFAVLHAICINPDKIIHLTFGDRTII